MVGVRSLNNFQTTPKALRSKASKMHYKHVLATVMAFLACKTTAKPLVNTANSLSAASIGVDVSRIRRREILP